MSGVIGLFGGGGETVMRSEKISDFQINTASYGEVVPDILGTTRVAGNVIYYDDFTAHEHRTSQRSGKGGGGHKTTQISYTYTVAVAIALSEGPVNGIGRVWVDKDIYTYPQSEIMMTFFNGSLGQSPWSYVQSKHPEKALPYSGLAYMAGVVDMGTQASLPTYNFEVKGKLLDTGDGVDVNPADYIAYVLRNIGIDTSNIEGLDNYRSYCANADLLISTPPSAKEQKAQEIVNDIAEFTNAYVFWSNDRLKIVPLADKPIGSWSPDTEIKYDLTADDFLQQTDGTLVMYKRKDSSECYNQATVEFINRDNGYEKEAVSFDVVADIQANGMRPAPLKSIHYLYTKKRASYVAEQMAMRQLYLKNQYTFKLDWAFCRLEPGDLLTITDEASMLDRRVVVVTDVQEAVDGELTITAVGKPPGLYSPARYNVHDVERPFVDFNAEPPNVENVTIVQPPGDVGNGNELLIGVTAPNGWGSCNVWVSDSGDSYKLVGTINQQARIGYITSSIAATDTECTVKMYNGTLKSGTAKDAVRGNTLCLVDGECFSYETATLQADGTYRLTGLVRGQYGTVAQAHSMNARFSRLDEAFYRWKYRDEDIDKTLYFKFTSMNIFGGHEQSLSDVQATSYVVQSYYIPEVEGLSLHTRYQKLRRGVTAYDVVAQFTPPGITSFDVAEAYYREGTDEWKFGGSGVGQIVISGLTVGHTYDVRVQVKDSYVHYSQGITQSITVAMKADVPNTPQGFSVRFADRAYFAWLEVTNADIDYYEVRMDKNPGVAEGQLVRNNNTTADALLQQRDGTLYLYAHNPIKGYSAPAMLSYSLPVPVMPSNVVVKASMGTLQVQFAPVPSGCRGANVYIDNNVYYVTNNVFSIGLDAGIYNVSVAYVDMIGEGPRTDEQMVTVKVLISKEMLADEAITSDKLDAAVKEALQKGVDANDATVNIVKSLNNEEGSTQYTALTQLSDAIQLKVNKDDIINQINMSPTTTTIDGKYFHVTGETVFDNNVIASGMIQANAISSDKLQSSSVTADKLRVDSLSAVSANIGLLRTSASGARVEIQNNLIQVFDSNGRLRVRLGVW